MNNVPLLIESFRWYGPSDPVPLSYIRQAGATAVYTALHHIPYGEIWPREEIRARKAELAAAGLSWAAVESLPVHEDIKVGRSDCSRLFENYRVSLRNLAAEGVTTVIYNFMPVLDWVRTDLEYRMADGSTALRFDPVQFCAFELFALRRPGAEADHPTLRRQAARIFWDGMDAAAQRTFVQGLIDVFPGCAKGTTLDDVRRMLARYAGIGREQLKANYRRFLEEVVPTAEEVGARLAVHPDDPPFPILGLPRIVSTPEDIADLLAMVDSPANGLCFCAGSYSGRLDNDVAAMARRFASRIHATHLRSTAHAGDGSFYEANHLEGVVDMPALVQVLLQEQVRRRAEGRRDWQLAFRPDHGHTMMDDLAKPPTPNPGYSCIGRMRGLAELRGLQTGLARVLAGLLGDGEGASDARASLVG